MASLKYDLQPQRWHSTANYCPEWQKPRSNYEIVLATQFNPKNSTQKPILGWWEFASMAYKWNIGRKWTKISKWWKCKVDLWNCVTHTINPKFPLKNHFTMVRVLPKWHLNGKLAENGIKCPKRHKIAVELNSG